MVQLENSTREQLLTMIGVYETALQAIAERHGDEAGVRSYHVAVGIGHDQSSAGRLEAYRKVYVIASMALRRFSRPVVDLYHERGPDAGAGRAPRHRQALRKASQQ